MYSSLDIENFRGLRKVSFSNLKRVNLLVGRNNAGKTSVLEALYLMTSATNPISAMTISQLRGQRFGGESIDSVWRPLFRDLDVKNPIRFGGSWIGERAERELVITGLPVTSYVEIQESQRSVGVASSDSEFTIGGLCFTYENARGQALITKAIYDPATERIEAPSLERDDLVRSTFVSARSYPSLARDAQQFSYLLKTKREGEVLEALRIVEPRLQRIEVISEASGPSVYIDIGLESLVPIAVSGEGFVRLFSIIVELTGSRGGVLLIDEIDNGLHHSVMEELWVLMGEMAERHDVQVFGTTHNDEMIRSSLRQLNHLQGGIGLYRLDVVTSGHSVVEYDSESIEGVLDGRFEVRA